MAQPGARRMMRKVFILVAPLALLVLLELVFRLGLWEPMAKPTSHAGTSVRLKRMLLDAQLARIDFVTLGSSRPSSALITKALPKRPGRRVSSMQT
ncbi:MAG: hypothetical protein IPH43_15280 [Xanthomonadales bacterium]|nr:hypothetical protein [Xanthomonadales bacterium]